MRGFAFISILVAEALLGFAFLVTLLSPERRIWPPPGRRTWQFYTVWILIDYCYLSFVLVGILDWNSFILGHWIRYPIGALLILPGFGLIVWGIRTLSYTTSLGLGGRFAREGPYRFSRNPQYVGFLLLMAGYAILTNSWKAWITAAFGALLFLTAPFLEEPWLENQFGADYQAYKEQVPRFVGMARS